MSPGRTTRWLFVILGLALLLRCSTAAGLQWALDHKLNRPYLIMGDAEGYWELGKKLAHGQDYSVYINPPKQMLRMPGLPSILGVSIALFGDEQLPARLLLAIVGTLACGAVFLLGKELFSPTTGLIAAALAAITPTFVGYAPLILSETPFALFITLNLAALARLLNQQRSAQSAWPLMVTAMLCGLLLAAGQYMRPSWLMVSPFMAAVVLINGSFRRTSWLATLVMASTAFVCMLPWGLRSERLTGHFLLGTLISGISLYDGLNPNATGESNYDAFEQVEHQERYTEYELDREYRNRALQFARENPGRVVELAGSKLLHYWRPWFISSGFSHWALQVAAFLSFIPALSLAVVAVCKLRPGWQTLALTLFPILFFCVVHMVFTSSPRYRLPFEFPLLVLSAAGLQCLLNWPFKTPTPADQTTI